MRQTDFALVESNCRLRHARLCVIAGTSLVPDVPLIANLFLARKAGTLKGHLRKLRAQMTRIATGSHDITKCDERTSLRDFLFTTSEILDKILPLFGYNTTATARSRYRCDAVLAQSVVIRRLASGLDKKTHLRYSKARHSDWEACQPFLG